MKTIGKYIFLTLASVFVSSYAVMATEPVKTKGVSTAKRVDGPDNNIYTLTLESFVEANVEEETISTPLDIVLVLDVSGSMYGSKIQTLRTSVNNFIGIIQHKANYWDDTDTKPRSIDEKVHHRIGIVQFSNVKTARTYPSKILSSFVDVTDNSSVSNLTAAVGNLNANGYTAAADGMSLANDLMAFSRTESNKVVVMFTDGEPTNEGYYETVNAGNVYADRYTVAASAINTGETIKSKYDAKIFAIGVFGTLDSDTQNFVDGYMSHLSSNYEGTQAVGTNSTIRETWAGYYEATKGSIVYNNSVHVSDDYYKKGDISTLNSIFESIAHGMSGAAIDLGSDVKVIDEVTSSFALPENANENDIKVYLVDCTSENADGSLNFDNPSFSNQVWPSNETYKPTLSPRDADGITHLEVKGFNFSENYCGRYYNEAGTSYTIGGKKLVITIPIVIDQNAIGGLGVYTNTDQSGLYRPLKDEEGHYILDEDGNIQYENISSYAPKPTIDVPVNIQIRKAGLDKGESVVFNISRCAIMTTTDEAGNTRPQRDEDGNYILSSAGYQPYTTMVVTGNDVSGYENGVLNPNLVDQLPISKLSGLHPGYVYKIVEGGWSWTYSNQESSITTGGSEQTTQGVSVNPFIFDNKKINTDVKNAEAVAHNRFVSKTSSK